MTKENKTELYTLADKDSKEFNVSEVALNRLDGSTKILLFIALLVLDKREMMLDNKKLKIKKFLTTGNFYYQKTK